MARPTGTYERSTIAGESGEPFIPHPLPPTEPPLDADVEEVCGYVDALNFAWDHLGRADGLPLSMRLLSATHARSLRGAHGAQKQSGEVRLSQSWIGGTRPGSAAFVPPPPHRLGALLGETR